ncbi:MAG: peptidylprolyl isomerase, partial [Bacteroides acidifaciens]
IESRPATNEEIQEVVKMMSGEGGCGCGCDSCGGGCGDHGCGDSCGCEGGHCH